jgi:hypothetical protein
MRVLRQLEGYVGPNWRSWNGATVLRSTVRKPPDIYFTRPYTASPERSSDSLPCFRQSSLVGEVPGVGPTPHCRGNSPLHQESASGLGWRKTPAGPSPSKFQSPSRGGHLRWRKSGAACRSRVRVSDPLREGDTSMHGRRLACPAWSSAVAKSSVRFGPPRGCPWLRPAAFDRYRDLPRRP